MTKRRLTWVSILILYAVTWVGGWVTCARELEDIAWARYRRAREVVDRDLAGAREAGQDTSFYEGALFPDAPKYGLWCIPLLPGIILVESYALTGQLYGGGETDIRFFYGFGATPIFFVAGWRA